MKNNNIFRNFIDNILIITLLLCSSLFTSCLNLLSDGQDTPERENSSYVILEGTINPKNIENNSRYAYPTITEIPNGSSYYYKAIVTNGTNTATGEGSFSSWADAKYSLKVPYGTWTNIIVKIYKESTCINKIYEGTKTINLVVNETSPATVGEEVIVKPQQITGLTGNINLTIYNNTTTDPIYAKMLYSGSAFTAPTEPLSIQKNSSASFEINNATPGAHDVTINFYKQSNCSGRPYYSCLETINVYSDLTTNLWGGNIETSPHLQQQEDGSVRFILTQDLFRRFEQTTIYVGTPTEGTGNGSYLNPVSNLSEALNLCTSTLDFYKIYLKNDITITSDISIDRNITILPEDTVTKTITGDSTLKLLTLSKTVSFNNLILNNIKLQNSNSSANCQINNCKINNTETDNSINFNNGSLSLSGLCSLTGKISLGSGKKITLTGVVSPPDTDSDGIVATILTNETTISNIFLGDDEYILGSLDYFNILPSTYTATTPARQFIDFSNSSNLNNYELFVVRYVADSSPTTNGLGVAGEDNGDGTKLKPYNDVFNAADSFDNDLDTANNGQTANAIDNYKYLIFIAGTVGVNNGDPNRNLVFGSSGITASYYLRSYDSTKTNMIKRYNGGNYTTNRNLFTIIGNKIDVHVDNLTFDDSFTNNTILSASENNCFYIQSGADTSNKNSLELNNVTITSHKVERTGYAIKAEDKTTLKLNNVTITSCQGNVGGAIYYEGSDDIEIKGKILINDNKSGPSTSLKNSNICLYNESAKIKITDTLDTASRIGISNRIPTRANPKIVFTDGFSTNTPSGTEPTTIFSSDEGYIICQDNNEVAVAGVAYGSIKPKIKDDVVLVANGTAFINGQQNKVEIVPKIDGMKIEDDKLSDWKLKLKCFGSEINLDNTSSTTMPYKSGNNKIIFPANTPVEGVTVYAEVKYNGAAYSTEVILTDDNILNLTSAPVSGQRVAITNQDGWNKLAEFAESNEKLDGVKVVLSSDIELDTPCTITHLKEDNSVDYNYYFAGSLDGQGHAIKINSIDNNFKSALIYKFNNNTGVIENIIIEGNLIISQEYTGIVASLQGGTIRNCINRCNVKCSTDSDIAGIMGSGTGPSQVTMDIIDCKNEGDLQGYGSIGGIVTKSNMGILKVIRCKNSGKITCLGNNVRYAGGIVGEGFSLFEDCMNSGTVTAKYYAGGIAGRFEMRKKQNSTLAETEYVYGIYNSYNTGDVSVTDNAGYCGGIIGYMGNSGSGSDQNNAIIENCYCCSEILTANNTSNVGGFVGKVCNGCNQELIKNNFYYKPKSVTYYGYAGTSSDDFTKVNPFTSFTEIESSMNTWVTNANLSDGYEFSNWTITYKNGKPQLDLNIFIEE